MCVCVCARVRACVRARVRVCFFFASFLFFLVHKFVLSAAGKCLCYCYIFAIAVANPYLLKLSHSMSSVSVKVQYLQLSIKMKGIAWTVTSGWVPGKLWFVCVFKWSSTVGVLYRSQFCKIYHLPHYCRKWIWNANSQWFLCKFGILMIGERNVLWKMLKIVYFFQSLFQNSCVGSACCDCGLCEVKSFVSWEVWALEWDLRRIF
jgi:hypothetical protein